MFAEVPSLVDVLTRLSAGAFVPVIVAFLLEQFPAFLNLPSNTKKWIVLALFILLPVGAAALVEFVPPDVWPIVEPFWRALALGFLGWLGSQVAHEWDRRRAERAG